MTELTVSQQYKMINGLAVGAGFLSGTGNLWVKGEGTMWVHRTGKVIRVFSTQEVIEREGAVRLVSYGEHRMMVEAPKHRGKISDELMQEQEHLLESLKEGDTILGKKNAIWVSVGDGHWVSTKAGRAFKMLKNRSVIEGYGPFVVHSNPPALSDEDLSIHMQTILY